MDLSTPNYFYPSSNGDTEPVRLEDNRSLYRKSKSKSKNNPFADNTFSDPLCKLNLKETSEFVKSLPMVAKGSSNLFEVSTKKRMEAPSTPGRPVFSFSVAANLSRKSFPSKWDDAQKWVMSRSSCAHESPVHSLKPPPPTPPPPPPPPLHSQQCDTFNQQLEVLSEKSKVTEEKVLTFQGSLSLDHTHNPATTFNGVSASTDVLLKDKFTNEVEAISRNDIYSEPSKEVFFFRNSVSETMDDEVVQHRDFGTEMTPLGSSTTSRCHTPFKNTSPARHNTPANRSGPLAASTNTDSVDISQLQECHLAKLQLGSQYDSVTTNWSSREEEEEEVSKSLRHFETGGSGKSISDSRATAWEEEERTKLCLRYQREEAKIQAWINLQSAKAEAQSKKLEVKIQKMRSNLEEKLMKKMTMVHRKAEEWREAAQQQHAEQIHKATEQAQRIINRHNTNMSSHNSCGCFPCNNHP